jgi:geranylgeranyl pyrophosphate synthase
VGGEADAYSYLPDSVRRFPPAHRLAAVMDSAGLGDIRYSLVAGGIVAIHRGTVPAGGYTGGPFERALNADRGRTRGLMDRAEEVLATTTAGHGRQLAATAGETLAAGGKRLRPLLVFISGGAEGEDGIVRAAAAVELVHMATLVHDDVLDAAPLRRSHPTVYASRGRQAAVATGDFLFSRAFALLAHNGSAEQVRVLAKACLALARGELAQRHDAFRPDVTEERYMMRCALKTASLFAAACRLGALAAGQGPAVVGALERYGARVGVAFQLLDDVLDVSGPPERTGKARGTDLLDGTVTLPLIIAREHDPELRAADLRSLSSREAAEEACDRIAASGALEQTRSQAARLVTEAKQALAGQVDRPLRGQLEDVADGIVLRYS